MNFVAVVGTLLKIDPTTISMNRELYARVLVDVDVSKRLPEKVLALLKTEKKDININFLVNFSFGKLTSFCAVCKAIGRDDMSCKRQNPNTQLLGRKFDGNGRRRDLRSELD